MSQPSPAQESATARRRAQLILQVQSGALSVRQAARQMGLSRKSYYKWEQRALAAMVAALNERARGRPRTPRDPEKETLRQQVQHLREKLQVLEQTLEIRRRLAAPEKKTPETCEAIVNTLQHLHQYTGWPYGRLCQTAGLPYSSLRRWRARRARGQPACQRPGPKPVAPLRLEQLQERLRELPHGPQRSPGAGALYQHYRGRISRRQFQQLVETARREAHVQHAAATRRVHWRLPGLVWSLDDSQLLVGGFAGPQRLYLQPVQDLGSRYKFAPLVDVRLPGERVAARLHALFLEHGAPLVLKRDNGGNLNHEAVDDVLAQHLVIPLNSPLHYPAYNGGMERAQREIKDWLACHAPAWAYGGREPLQLWSELAVADLNHRPRPCLGGDSACARFAVGQRLRRAYSARRRHEVFHWINELARAILERMADRHQRAADAAWRQAVETWLQTYGVIEITNPKSVTQFPRKKCS